MGIAGSIGPLMASFRPDLCPAPHEAESLYEPIVSHLAPSVDLLLIETMSSVDQAVGALRATDKASVPVWLSLTVNDFDGTKLRSGESLQDLRAAIEGHRVDALLINCTRPEAIEDA